MPWLQTQAVQADAREEETLRALGVRNLDVAIVAKGTHQGAVAARVEVRAGPA